MSLTFTGSNPNTRWKYVTDDKMKAHDRYFAIPKTRELLKKYKHLTEVPGHLYEQKTKEWFNARSGSVSASNFSTVLGFWERKTIKVFGDSKYRVDHNKVLDYLSVLKGGKRTPFPYISSIFAAWGTHHEANAVLTFLECNESLCVKETGFWKYDQTRGWYTKNGLPTIGASPDGLVHSRYELGNDNNRENEEEEEKEEEDLESYYYRTEYGKPGDPDDSVRDPVYDRIVENIEYTRPLRSTKPEEDPYFLLNKPIAVLEIKCPTHFIPRDSTNRGGEVNWSYRKRGPHSQIPYYYIPQIMLQMLCTNTNLCYFVSWTPTSGTNIFKVTFDKVYVTTMLDFVSQFNERYIKRNSTTPPKDFFFGAKNYGEFLDHTKKIIEKSTRTKRFIKRSVVSTIERQLFNQ